MSICVPTADLSTWCIIWGSDNMYAAMCVRSMPTARRVLRRALGIHTYTAVILYYYDICGRVHGNNLYIGTHTCIYLRIKVGKPMYGGDVLCIGI